MNLIAKIFNQYRKWLTIIRVFKPYFSNGIYWIKNDTLYKKPKFAPFLIILNHAEKIHTKPNATLLTSSVAWSQKLVIKKEPFILSLYRHKDSRKWFANIKKYINNFPYQFAKIITMNDEQLYIVTTYIKGDFNESPNELNVRIANYILLQNILFKQKTNDYVTKYFENNYVYLNMVQHGDFSFKNIIVSNDDFFVIDIDTIDIYPLMYDFFRFICDFPEVIKLFFNGEFDQLIERLFENTCDRNLTINQLKDKYLSLFMSISPQHALKFESLIPSSFILCKAFSIQK